MDRFGPSLGCIHTEAQFYPILSNRENQIAATSRNAGHRRQRDTAPDAGTQDKFAAFEQHLAVALFCAPLTVACGFSSHV